MNAHQRRKTYRSMPKPGAIVAYGRYGRSAPVLGLAVPANVFYGDAPFNRPSLYRIKLDLGDGATVSPKLSTSHALAKASAA